MDSATEKVLTSASSTLTLKNEQGERWLLSKYPWQMLEKSQLFKPEWAKNNLHGKQLEQWLAMRVALSMINGEFLSRSENRLALIDMVCTFGVKGKVPTINIFTPTNVSPVEDRVQKYWSDTGKYVLPQNFISSVEPAQQLGKVCEALSQLTMTLEASYKPLCEKAVAGMKSECDELYAKTRGMRTHRGDSAYIEEYRPRLIALTVFQNVYKKLGTAAFCHVVHEASNKHTVYVFWQDFFKSLSLKKDATQYGDIILASIQEVDNKLFDTTNRTLTRSGTSRRGFLLGVAAALGTGAMIPTLHDKGVKIIQKRTGIEDAWWIRFDGVVLGGIAFLAEVFHSAFRDDLLRYDQKIKQAVETFSKHLPEFDIKQVGTHAEGLARRALVPSERGI